MYRSVFMRLLRGLDGVTLVHRSKCIGISQSKRATGETESVRFHFFSLVKTRIGGGLFLRLVETRIWGGGLFLSLVETKIGEGGLILSLLVETCRIGGGGGGLFLSFVDTKIGEEGLMVRLVKTRIGGGGG